MSGRESGLGVGRCIKYPELSNYWAWYPLRRRPADRDRSTARVDCIIKRQAVVDRVLGGAGGGSI